MTVDPNLPPDEPLPTETALPKPPAEFDEQLHLAALDLDAALAEALVAVQASSQDAAAAAPAHAEGPPAEGAPQIRGAIPTPPIANPLMELYNLQRSTENLQVTLDRALEDAAQSRADLSAARRRFLKLSDELESARAGAARGEAELRASGTRRALEAILPALDAQDAMLDHLVRGEVLTLTGREGVEMLRVEWQRTLQSLGVQTFDALGAVFDPNTHDAVASQVAHDVPAGQVLRQLSRGYLLHNRLLRSARVVVSRAAAASSAAIAGEELGADTDAAPTDAGV